MVDGNDTVAWDDQQERAVEDCRSLTKPTVSARCATRGSLTACRWGHGRGGPEPRSSSARAARRGRFANQAAGAQICQGVGLIDGDQARDATAPHCHDDLGAVLDVLDVAAEAVVQLADANLSLQRFAM